MSATLQYENLIPIPGTSVRAFVNKSRRAPGWWTYMLFDSDGHSRGDDSLDLSGLGDVTAEQVARMAFILEEEVEEN